MKLSTLTHPYRESSKFSRRFCFGGGLALQVGSGGCFRQSFPRGCVDLRVTLSNRTNAAIKRSQGQMLPLRWSSATCFQHELRKKVRNSKEKRCFFGFYLNVPNPKDCRPDGRRCRTRPLNALQTIRAISNNVGFTASPDLDFCSLTFTTFCKTFWKVCSAANPSHAKPNASEYVCFWASLDLLDFNINMMK